MDISYHFMLDAPKGDSGDTRMDQVDHGDVSLCDNSPNRQFSSHKGGITDKAGIWCPISLKTTGIRS
jgi:hypothetical protein